MIQYAKFGIICTTTDAPLVEKYEMFKKKCAKYCVDEEMELYYIPIKTEIYEYAHDQALLYPSSDDIWDESPAMYITESDLIQTEYNKRDLKKALAYMVNFGCFAYDYEELSSDEFVGSCCETSAWSTEPCSMQCRNYMIPKSEFAKKKYAKLMLGYAVADEVAALLIQEGQATANDFWSVTTKKGEHICYQLTPTHTIRGFMKENGAKVVDCCKSCGRKRYNPCNEPFYMSEKLVSELQGLNRTEELQGPIIEKTEIEHGDIGGRTLEPLYIVNKQTYQLLHERYPRMQFIPIFSLEEKLRGEENMQNI